MSVYDVVGDRSAVPLFIDFVKKTQKTKTKNKTKQKQKQKTKNKTKQNKTTTTTTTTTKHKNKKQKQKRKSILFRFRLKQVFRMPETLPLQPIRMSRLNSARKTRRLAATFFSPAKAWQRNERLVDFENNLQNLNLKQE